MSKPTLKSSPNIKLNEVINSSLDRRYRHSFQPKSSTELPPSSLRHTQSHRYDEKHKKSKGPVTVYQIPSIMEADNSEDEIEKTVELRKEKIRIASVVYENEKKSSKTNAKSKKIEANAKAVFSYENAAFEGNINTKRNSNATIRTNSSRAPSVQSLEVVREQYCCCAKRTRCERILLTAVTVLIIIIIVLVIVVVIVAKHKDLDNLTKNYLKL